MSKFFFFFPFFKVNFAKRYLQSKLNYSSCNCDVKIHFKLSQHVRTFNLSRRKKFNYKFIKFRAPLIVKNLFYVIIRKYCSLLLVFDYVPKKKIKY